MERKLSGRVVAHRGVPLTQANITRMIKAALAAGVGLDRLAGVKLTHDGAILLFGEPQPAHPETLGNEWDEVLKK